MPDSGKLFKRLKVAFQWIADQGTPFFDVPDAASPTTPTDRSIFKIPINCHVTQDLPDVLGRKESIASRRSRYEISCPPSLTCLMSVRRTWKNTSARPFDSAELDTIRLEDSNPSSTGRDATFTCRHCLSGSPLVYDNSPMCLQGDCPLLWKVCRPGALGLEQSLIWFTSLRMGRFQATINSSIALLSFNFGKNLPAVFCSRLASYQGAYLIRETTGTW